MYRFHVGMLHLSIFQRKLCLSLVNGSISSAGLNGLDFATMNLLAPLYTLADRIRYRIHGNLGRHGEDLAHRYLRRNGYTVVARNWRPPGGGGEIDLVAWKGGTLVFIEVKTRATDSPSAPERAIDPDKVIALRRTARSYVRRADADPSKVRFDVAAISGEVIEYFEDAFPFSA